MITALRGTGGEWEGSGGLSQRMREELIPYPLFSIL
jgi:hypothetical protein